MSAFSVLMYQSLVLFFTEHNEEQHPGNAQVSRHMFRYSAEMFLCRNPQQDVKATPAELEMETVFAHVNMRTLNFSVFTCMLGESENFSEDKRHWCLNH